MCPNVGNQWKTILQQTSKMGKCRCNEQKFNKNYNKIAQEKSTINRVTTSQVVLCVSVPELSCDAECWLCPTCDSSRGCPRIVSIISSNVPRSLFYPSRITPRDNLYHEYVQRTLYIFFSSILQLLYYFAIFFSFIFYCRWYNFFGIFRL